ncbi:MAG: single-stranded DNA-binding protein [Oscillospiraceae bacterium]|nr:single-stranded DNA-binding protein [Oscillospiraceae bacterium]
MLNKIFLQGRLVADPELKQTASGVSVCTFRIAVERDFKNKETGEKETDFISIVAWRNSAEFVSRYFSKGRLAIVEGRLQMRSYTDKEGVKRTVAEVVADNIYFGDSKRDNDSTYTPPAQTQSPDYGTPLAGEDQFSELSDESELPF